MIESADDRSRKRLTVAAAEVARIGDIVEGYASYARPLDVLTPAEEDVGAMVHTLVSLMKRTRSARGARGARGPVLGRRRCHPLRPRSRSRSKTRSSTSSRTPRRPPAEGLVRVTYGLSTEASTPGHLTFTVSDSGKGMDEPTLARLGTPFFTQREGGTGLGVALARQVAQQHDGTLSFESVLGRGTRALITIPPGLSPALSKEETT